MDSQLLEIHRRLDEDFPFFARSWLTISPKIGAMQPLILNVPQTFLHKSIEDQKQRIGRVRKVILKGRQEGISTYIEGRIYRNVTRWKNRKAFILSHEGKTTDLLFSMVTKYHRGIPEAARPVADTDNQRRLTFPPPVDSEYGVGTAGNDEVGRGGTLTDFHGSEVGFWEGSDDIEAGIMQSVSDSAGTEMYLESTANGMANMFYRRCMAAMRGEDVFELVFIPWYWMLEYAFDRPMDGVRELTDDEEAYRALYCPAPGAPPGLTPGQMWWRRAKIQAFAVALGTPEAGARKFKQEYPAFVQEAFQVSGNSLIDSEAIMKARRSKIVDPKAPMIMALDPGRTKDRSVFAYRRGRQFFTHEVFRFSKTDDVQMTLAGMAVQRIKRFNPAKMFIDVGEGWGVVDRLKELGYGDIVTGVHFGSQALQPDIYANKRAEIWCTMRDWFHCQEGPVGMPDSDEAHQDLASMPDHKPTSGGKIQLESKDVIRKKFGKSPDIGDAYALTFAFPVAGNFDQTRIRVATKRAESSLISVRRVKRYNTRRER